MFYVCKFDCNYKFLKIMIVYKNVFVGAIKISKRKEEFFAKVQNFVTESRK